ncbi:Sapep family Mn(2+)-dependent dipeptidase, partial [Eubacteriales bacterium OttesenSCG-928-N13]|nr:Sapep family Mn(2+)-dependent dipeptidase [Eubacteriales bacterium OttesenSCG-928-N13]
MDLKKLDMLIDSWQQEIFDKLKTWIAIDSVSGERTAPNAPFGDGCRRALDLFLKDAAEMGFDTLDVDGYAGHAQFGQGEKTLGILAHLDIVPAGDGWTHDPFGGEIADGKCFGRGTIDDKGPLLGALYALKAVKQLGIPLKHGVRVIAGCDEETGMSDMRYYASKVQVPDYGFSPDAEFPLINIEKGGLNLNLHADHVDQSGAGIRVLSAEAGERINVVPGIATAVIECTDLAVLREKLTQICAAHEGFDLAAQMDGEGKATITATGVGAHASMPHLGVNAAGMLLIALKELGAADAFCALADALGMEGNGASLGIQCADELSGELTCNLGLLRFDGEDLSCG